MNRFLLLLVIAVLPDFCLSQVPVIQWQKALGGTADDMVMTMKQTADAGFIVSGVTASKDGDVSNARGKGDIWIVKMNMNGTIQWKKILGGPGEEQGANIIQTTDGGYIVIGNTSSSSGDVKGFHGGTFDIWVVKLSSTGTIEWQKCLGGSNLDEYTNIKLAADGGYIVTGNTMSNNGDVSGHHGGYDIWVIKLTTSGTIQWQRALGSSGDEKIRDLQILSNGDYVFAGYTINGFNGDVLNYHVNTDVWVGRLSASGHLLWNRALGGSGYESHFGNLIETSPDGGFLLITSTESIDGDIQGVNDGDAGWLLKFDASNQIVWQRLMTNATAPVSATITTDHSYIIATHGEDGDPNTYGALFIKISESGELLWQKQTGGTGTIQPALLQATVDGGCIVAGYTNSNSVPGYHKGLDVWMTSIDGSGNILWQQAYGGSNNDFLQGLTAVYSGTTFPISLGLNALWCRYNAGISASGGGYYFAVSTGSPDGDVSGFHYNKKVGYKFDYWVVKLNYTSASVTRPSFVNETKLNNSNPFIFPNPAQGHTTISFTTAIKGTAFFELFDENGKRVKIKHLELFEEGIPYSRQINLFGLANGIYTYRLTQGKHQSGGQLIKVK